MISAENVRRFTIFDQADSSWRVACAYLCAILFVLGMGLAGTSKLSGIFYASSLVFSLPILSQISWRKLRAGAPAGTYAIVYSLILALYCLHVLLLGRELGNLDNISRVGLGFINGAFFLAFFRHERQSLFFFLLILAFVHSTIAAAVSIWQGVEFSTLTLSMASKRRDNKPHHIFSTAHGFAWDRCNLRIGKIASGQHRPEGNCPDLFRWH